jgi:hypothetical protein
MQFQEYTLSLPLNSFAYTHRLHHWAWMVFRGLNASLQDLILGINSVADRGPGTHAQFKLPAH